MTAELIKQEEFSEGAYEMLYCAVRVARDRSIRKVAALRTTLEAMFPGRAEDIKQGLIFWVNYEKSKGRVSYD
jgi:hypothetical protein